MTPEEQAWSDFVTSAMQFIAMRPGSNVMIIVDGPRGFELYRSVPNLPWAVGAARMAEETLKHLIRLRVDAEENEKREREEEGRIKQAIDATKGKAN